MLVFWLAVLSAFMLSSKFDLIDLDQPRSALLNKSCPYPGQVPYLMYCVLDKVPRRARDTMHAMLLHARRFSGSCRVPLSASCANFVEDEQ